MNEHTYERVTELFLAARDLPHDDVPAFLNKECNNDSELRLEVEKLLNAYQSQFLEKPIMERVSEKLIGENVQFDSSETPSPDLTEPVISSYKIIKRISQGGMGTVYLAERSNVGFKQQVAIKFINRGMDSTFLINKFRDERQILAALNHRGIARLLDGGTTADGRPYIVMEYIKGKRITDFADEHCLDTVARLSLFKEVCSAVQYAHQNLVIHRDIKPFNILVTEESVPKLLDFGIAKLLNPEIADHPIELTAAADRLLTPEYASPEQVTGESITTSSDVYALGLLLYELLTGHHPYRFRKRTDEEIRRVVCEEIPKRPSLIIGEVEHSTEGREDVTPESVSRTREGSPDKLRRRLAGDLDTIILMAMRKEPSRRYTTVDQFATDIDRHLCGLPVIARKPTTIYRLSKFSARHKTAVAVTLLILIAAIVGLIALRQHTRAEQQRLLAEQRAHERRTLLTSFLIFQDKIKDMPGMTEMREESIKTLIASLDSLALEAADDTQLKRELAVAYQKVGDALGNPYENNFGERTKANENYQKSLRFWRSLVDRGQPTVEDRRGIAVISLRIGQLAFGLGHVRDALDACESGLGIAETLYASNELDLATTHELPNGYRTIGLALSRLGKAQAAFDRVEKGRAIFQDLASKYPNDSQIKYDFLNLRSIVADALVELGEYRTALAVFNAVLPFDKRRAGENRSNVQFQIALAIDYRRIAEVELLMSNAESAAESFRKMLEIIEPVVADDKTNVRAQNLLGIGQARLGTTLLNLEQYPEALKYLNLSIPFFKTIAENDPESPSAQISLAYTVMKASVALAHTGSVSALQQGDSARKVAEDINAKDSQNVEFRGIRAAMYMMSGDIRCALSTKSHGGPTLDDARAMQEWYQLSFDILKALKDEGKSTDPEYGTPELLQSKMRECDRH
jgi:eukaryotic-like serine/threonine-protein kinase